MTERRTMANGLELHYGWDERGSSWASYPWSGGKRRVQVCFRSGADFRFEGSFEVDPGLVGERQLVSSPGWGAALYDPATDEVTFQYPDA